MFNWNLIWMAIRQEYCKYFGHDIRDSQYDNLACIRCGATLQAIRNGK